MFAVVTLGYLEEIALDVYSDPHLANRARQLKQQIDDGNSNSLKTLYPGPVKQQCIKRVILFY